MRILRPTGTFFIFVWVVGVEVFGVNLRGRLRIGLPFIIPGGCCRRCYTLLSFLVLFHMPCFGLETLHKSMNQKKTLMRQNDAFSYIR